MGLYTAFIKGTALTAATAKTVINLNTTAGNRNRIVEWGVSFDGVNAANVPVAVDILRTTSTGTVTAFTPLLLDPADAAAESTVGTAATVEPTPSDILETILLTPNGGLFVKQYPLGREIIMGVSGRLGIRCNAPATVNATAYIVWEEF